MGLPSGNAISCIPFIVLFPSNVIRSLHYLLVPDPQTRIISSRVIMVGGPLCLCSSSSSSNDGEPSSFLLAVAVFLIIYGSASFSSPYWLLVIRCTSLKDSPARKRQIAFAPRPRPRIPSGVTPPPPPPPSSPLPPSSSALPTPVGRKTRDGTRTWLAGTNVNRMKSQTRL